MKRHIREPEDLSEKVIDQKHLYIYSYKGDKYIGVFIMHRKFSKYIIQSVLT